MRRFGIEARTACLAITVAWAHAAGNQEPPEGLLPPADRSQRILEIRQAILVKDFEIARNKIEQLSEREPRNFEGPFWLGILALERQNNYEAIRAFRRAEALDPNPYVFKALGVAYYAVHQYKLFLLKMNEALQKQPSDFAPYYYLGRYYDSELTDFAKAATYFREALRRNPDHFRSHYYLGYCYEVEQKIDQAEAEYVRSRELAELQGVKDGLPYQGLARLRLAADRPAEALMLARRAVELGPRDPAGHRLLARTLGDLGRHAEAASEWKISAALDPTDSQALYRLYRCYLVLGETEKARDTLARYRKIAALYGTN